MTPHSDPPDDAELRALLAGEISVAREREIGDWLEHDSDLRDRLSHLSGEADFPDAFGSSPRAPDGLNNEGDADRFDLSWLAPPLADDSLGRIGKFEVLGVSGSGGMGTVFRARDPDLNRIVAIKVLRPSRAGDEKIVARFRQEASAIAAIDHEHVLPVYEIGEVEGGVFFVMRFVEGETLRQRMERHPNGLPIRESVRIALALARALEAAHMEGIIHRDVNPANVMIDEDDHVWLMDFGLAESIETPGFDPDHRIAGTPAYMAPEQVDPDAEIDVRTDLFGLGATLYCVLTGRPPRPGEDLVQTLWSAQHESISEVDRRGLPSDLRKLASRLLEKNSDDRPENASEVIRSLRLIERPPLGKRRSVKILGATILAALLTKLAVSGIQRHRAANPFVISGGQRFPSLEAAALAVQETEGDRIIEVQGNGLYSLSRSVWRGPVTITAGGGFLPVLVAEPGDVPVWTSSGGLTLRGLTIRFPASAEKFGLFLRIDSGRLTAEHCRFAMPESPETLQRLLPKRAFIDGSGADELVIERCEFVGREMTCFVLQPPESANGKPRGSSLRFRENAIRARSVVQFESPPQSPASPMTVLFEDNVARVHNVFVFGERERGKPASFVPVAIQARRNVFEGRYAVAFVSSHLGGQIRDWLQWRGEENAYGMDFISSDRDHRDGVRFPASLSEWRDYTGSPEIDSITARTTILDFEDDASTLAPGAPIFEDGDFTRHVNSRSPFLPERIGPRAWRDDH